MVRVSATPAISCFVNVNLNVFWWCMETAWYIFSWHMAGTLPLKREADGRAWRDACLMKQSEDEVSQKSEMLHLRHSGLVRMLNTVHIA